MSTHQEAIRNAMVVRDLKALCIEKAWLTYQRRNCLGKAVHSSYTCWVFSLKLDTPNILKCHTGLLWMKWTLHKLAHFTCAHIYHQHHHHNHHPTIFHQREMVTSEGSRHLYSLLLVMPSNDLYVQWWKQEYAYKENSRFFEVPNDFLSFSRSPTVEGTNASIWARPQHYETNRAK